MDTLIHLIKKSGTNPTSKQLGEIKTKLWALLSLEDISTKPKNLEASKNKIKRAIENIEKLEADSQAIELLSTGKDASTIVRNAKEKMKTLLTRLESEKNFSTSGEVNSINTLIRKLRPFS